MGVAGIKQWIVKQNTSEQTFNAFFYFNKGLAKVFKKLIT